MCCFFDPVNERAKAGGFMVAGGYKILKEALAIVERNYQLKRNSEEMGSKFSAVLEHFQNHKVCLY